MSVTAPANAPAAFDMPNGLSVFGLSLNDTLNVYNDIFIDDCYRKHGVTIQDGDCILDIGANTGLFILFLNSIGAKFRVYGFEPAPATFNVLKHNVEKHNKLSVEIFNVGISKEPGTAAFTYYPRFSNASTFFPDESPESARAGRLYILDQIPTLAWPMRPICRLMRASFPDALTHLIAERFRRYYLKKEIVTCAVWNLSDFIREHQIDRIDLLKLDAEQSEELILAGIAEEDWLKIRQAVIEVHGGEKATQAIVDMLKKRGFNAVIDSNPAMPALSLIYAVRPEFAARGEASSATPQAASELTAT